MSRVDTLLVLGTALLLLAVVCVVSWTRHRRKDTRSDANTVQADTINGGVHVYATMKAPPPVSTGNAFAELVSALLAVPCVRDEASRTLLLSLLRPDISSTVPHQPRARPQVIALVRTCQNYDGGLDDLLRVLAELEGESIPVRRAAKAVRVFEKEITAS